MNPSALLSTIQSDMAAAGTPMEQRGRGELFCARHGSTDSLTAAFHENAPVFVVINGSWPAHLQNLTMALTMRGHSANFRLGRPLGYRIVYRGADG